MKKFFVSLKHFCSEQKIVFAVIGAILAFIAALTPAHAVYSVQTYYEAPYWTLRNIIKLDKPVLFDLKNLGDPSTSYWALFASLLLIIATVLFISYVINKNKKTLYLISVIIIFAFLCLCIHLIVCAVNYNYTDKATSQKYSQIIIPDFGFYLTFILFLASFGILIDKFLQKKNPSNKEDGQ